jgi:biopolymer transport protein ExbB/TolQ
MLRQFMDLGGPLMWPLFACSILLGAVLVERFLVVGVRYRMLGGRPAARKLLWHRRVLPFFTDVPPSLGLLGTVVGVVRSFGLFDGRLTNESLGIGLGIACMTTIFGLGIAIVASVSGYVLDWAAGEVE